MRTDTIRPAIRAGRWDRRDNRLADPEPGHFLLRLVPRGPHVPAQIHRSHAGGWWATIDGKEHRASVDPHANEFVMQVWHHGVRCTVEDYDYALSVKRWALEHQPEHPALHPRRPIALNSLPPVIP